MRRFSRNATADIRDQELLDARDGGAAEDALLRAWARILREAAEAERSAHPVLRVVGAGRRRRPGKPGRDQ